VASEIDAVSRADVNPKLAHAVADRLAIPEIPRLNPQQADANTSFDGLVTQASEPIRERLAAVLALIPE
jgi:hypothetical protein